MRRRFGLTCLIAAIAMLATGCFVARQGTAGGPGTDGGLGDTGVCVPGSPELCNGVDDDCDPSTPDGADEPERCDSPEDPDTCEDDRSVCTDGVLECQNDADGAAIEICDGLDNDCDPSTDDGVDDPSRGLDCAVAGLCGTGNVQCRGGVLECDGPRMPEECNSMDDNCDGAIDETGCGCEVVHRDTRRYLFCTDDSRNWTSARDRCRSWGYELVSIEGPEEQRFVHVTASVRHDGNWWIGLNDRGSENNFEWTSGAAFGFTNWTSGQPNNFLFSENCVAMVTDENGDPEPGGWFDRFCSDSNRYICEESP